MAPSTALSLLAAALLSCLSACSSTRPSAPPAWPEVVVAELGTMRSVFFSDDLWFGSQPALEDLELASRRGVERVIDLGSAVGGGYSEACARLGLESIRLQLPADGPLPDASVDSVLQLLGEEGRPRTLMFDESGSASATLFAIHRAVHQAVPLEEALAEARRAGMDPDPGEGRVRVHVARLKRP